MSKMDYPDTLAVELRATQAVPKKEKQPRKIIVRVELPDGAKLFQVIAMDGDRNLHSVEFDVIR